LASSIYYVADREGDHIPDTYWVGRHRNYTTRNRSVVDALAAAVGAAVSAFATLVPRTAVSIAAAFTLCA
jgi:hypothetical protein